MALSAGTDGKGVLIMGISSLLLTVAGIVCMLIHYATHNIVLGIVTAVVFIAAYSGYEASVIKGRNPNRYVQSGYAGTRNGWNACNRRRNYVPDFKPYVKEYIFKKLLLCRI